VAAERQRRRAQIRWGAIAAVVAAAVVVAGIVLYTQRQNTVTIPEGTQTFEIASNDHTTDPVNYAQNPPAGGPHNPIWQNCGYYAAPVADEHAVHSLEHGAVWITYQPDLPQEQVSALRELADSQSYILVSPRDNLPSPVVASSWGHQIQLDSANDPRLQQFVRAFRLSPNVPEPGASCFGGTSATV
jgi:hypothetical protein